MCGDGTLLVLPCLLYAVHSILPCGDLRVCATPAMRHLPAFATPGRISAELRVSTQRLFSLILVFTLPPICCGRTSSSLALPASLATTHHYDSLSRHLASLAFSRWLSKVQMNDCVNHVVKVLGVVSSSKGAPYLLLEPCDIGALPAYLTQAG